MSLRTRFAIVVALVALVATAAASSLSYRATASRLDEAIEESLQRNGNRLAELLARSTQPNGDVLGPERGLPGDGPRRGRGQRPDPDAQLIATQWIGIDGSVLYQPNLKLPVSDTDRTIAAATVVLTATRTVSIDGTPFRMRTVGVPGVGSIQAARDISEGEAVKRDLFRRFVLLVAGTSLLAALCGWLLARQATKRLLHLERVVTGLAASPDLQLSEPLDTTGSDETARVSRGFAQLLSALSLSRDQQRRLVEDASHELRTPLTSLRTNASLLPRLDRLSPTDQASLVSDVRSEVDELVRLVDELVVAATNPRSAEDADLLSLLDAVEAAANPIRRRTGRSIQVNGNDDATVWMGSSGLGRVITNLLSNATKYDASSEPIEVTVSPGTLVVRDHGPGFPPEDTARVFDRFYRTEVARNFPGSGLGLSIVADVVHRWGGTVTASNHQDGGAIVTIRIPSKELASAEARRLDQRDSSDTPPKA
jgi:two-component system, OmpR family, sensor histidine kinase MprB